MRPSALESARLLLAILQRIPRRRYTTSTHLLEQLQAAGFALTLRSLQRHLDVLVQHYPLECDTRGKPYGYRWSVGSQGLNLPLLSAPEALLLQLARSELAHLLPARTLLSLAPIFDCARQQLDAHPGDAAARRWLKKAQRIPDALPLLAPKLNLGVFETVSDALYSEHSLELVYRNAQGKRQQRSVWPLGLVAQGQRLYLVCRFEGYANERIIALTRILQVQIGAPFAYPSEFELERYVQAGHFGVLRAPAVALSFRIRKALGLHLAESPLAADQRLVDEGEYLHLRATVPDTELLRRWLRGWGADLRDLELRPISAAQAADAASIDVQAADTLLPEAQAPDALPAAAAP